MARPPAALRVAKPSPTVPRDALPAEARAAVLAWFAEVGRALAFRGTRDPYAILVSEVMAQQTQVARVVVAWGRFMNRFPTVAALAAATPADVLRAWQGMGYDRRALNLRRAARAIVEAHGGRVPNDVAALERLPGIGPYTARAVASIAFGARVGAVDTNVRRVLGRVLAGQDAGALTPTELQSMADASVDPERPGDWTHAIMDVGATVCRPRSPRCEACPLEAWCRFATSRPDASSSAVPSARGSPASRATRVSRVRGVPFSATTRWLRGRIVDRLRSASGSAWSTVAAPVGDHDATAVRAALAALARDGIIERHETDPDRARLAIR